jgi:SsrA-binding protein
MAEIAHNSKARRDFSILETFEAGIVLRGSEVKTLRAGDAQINDAFARVDKNEVWLHNAHIGEYVQANRFGHAPKAPRKLLLHKSEIRKLLGLTAVKGNALIPLSLYWKNGKVKVSLALAKGKVEFDKRQDIKEREADRELKRATMHRLKRTR